MDRKLEIACFDLESAIIANRSKADRIEFCSDYSRGGLTPSLADFIALKRVCSKPVFVMIRPKGGHFTYGRTDLMQMKDDIRDFADHGADGFVFGALTAKGDIDGEANDLLLNAAGSLPCTFHRAFDVVPNPDDAIQAIIRSGFTTLLTSGGRSSAVDGVQEISRLFERYGRDIAILPGGGIRSHNVGILAKTIPLAFFHSSGIIRGSRPSVREINRICRVLSDMC